MEKRIGKQLKLLSSIVMAIIMFLSAVCGLYMMFIGASSDAAGATIFGIDKQLFFIVGGVVAMVGGTFFSLIPSMTIYGIGVAVEEAQEAKDNTERLLESANLDK